MVIWPWWAGRVFHFQFAEGTLNVYLKPLVTNEVQDPHCPVYMESSLTADFSDDIYQTGKWFDG